MCTSFKAELLTATHAFGTDVFKIALFKSNASLGADTTAYSSSDEAGDSGTYVAGGAILSGLVLTTAGGQALVDWTANPQWTGITVTARGALIYNASKANRAVVVLDFGADKTNTPANTFTITLPQATAYNAIVRIE